MTDEESGSGSEDLDDSTWQMLSQDGASALHNSEIEDLNMKKTGMTPLHFCQNIVRQVEPLSMINS